LIKKNTKIYKKNKILTGLVEKYNQIIFTIIILIITQRLIQKQPNQIELSEKQHFEKSPKKS